MKKKVYNFIDNDKKYVPILAKEIEKIFKTKANGDNVEYNITIKGRRK